MPSASSTTSSTPPARSSLGRDAAPGIVRNVRRTPVLVFAALRVAARSVALTLAVLAASTSARGAAAPLPQVAPGGKTPYVAVLVWHDVCTPKEVWFDTDVATLASQLDAIRRGGFHVVGLARLRDHLERGTPLPSKP